MQSISLQRLSRCSWFFLFLASTLPATGCIAAAVTAGVAGAGAAGYITWQAAVPQDFPADIDVTWAVTQQALAELGMTIDTAKRDNDTAFIDTRTGDGTPVHITLEPRTSRIPIDGKWTHVTVKVGVVGDSKVAERLFSRMDSHLQPPQPPRLVPVAQQPPFPPAAQSGPPPAGSR